MGKRLADAGLIPIEEYSEIVRQAMEDIERIAINSGEFFQRGEDGSLVSGSWRITETYRSSDEAFQVIEAEAMDAYKRPLPRHIHDEDEYMHVLSGHVMLLDEGQRVMLGPSSCYRIMKGNLHSATPLDANVRTMITFIPAGPLFSKEG